MDYDKIGLFIANERKALGLTQANLAEKLFVSEKTISKWENGKGLPETSLLPKLCEILGVNLNELLSGEKNVNDKAPQNNEQLLLNMAKELKRKNKIIWNAMWVIMSVSIIALIAGLILTAFFVPEGFGIETVPILAQ